MGFSSPAVSTSSSSLALRELQDAFAQKVVQVDDAGHVSLGVGYGQHGDGFAFHDVQKLGGGLTDDAAFGVYGHDAGHG